MSIPFDNDYLAINIMGDNTLTIIGFDIVHRIDYRSRTLRNEHFRAWILA